MTENTDADGGESLADKIRVSRRTVLSALGTGAGAAVLGSASTSNGGEQLSMGGVTNLTEQMRRQTYVTSPSSAFDPSALKENELFWVSDTGELGIKGPNGTEHPGIGSASQPVPAVHTDELTNVYDHVFTAADSVADIEAELSSDGRYFFAAGTYNVGSSISLDSLANVTLEGMGPATIFKPTADVTVFESTTGETVGITLTSLTIDLNRPNTFSYGVQFTQAINCRIENCTLRNGRNAGITFDGTEHSEYGRGSFITNCTFDDIYTAAETPAIKLTGKGAEYCTISENHFDRCDIGVLATTGNQEIVNNTISNSPTAGIKLESGTNGGKCLVHGNTINHGSQYGIWVVGCDHNQIQNNTLKVTDEHAIFIDGMKSGKVTDNDIHSAGKVADVTYDAIHLESTAATATDNTVKDNYAQSNVAGNGNNVNYGVNESDASTSGNVVKHNETKAANGYNLNTSATPATIASGNETL